ncbi:hypothetical protein SDC9_202987 [bioreactor metagenome]|uniref:Uncharacterized protein n=1 Tax=bioreactor metagenome TaxID=1076179 RepID=A0A645IV51_9ZZZZ
MFFGVLRRTLEVVGGGVLANQCRMRHEIRFCNGGRNRRQRRLQSRLKLVGGNGLLDQFDGGGNIQTVPFGTVRVVERRFAAAGEVHCEGGIHGRGACGSVDFV